MKRVVNVFVADVKNGKFLAVRRASLDKLFGEMWALPGGKIEEGETKLQAMKREMIEETGVALEELSSEPALVTKPTLLGQQIELSIFDGKIVCTDFIPQDTDISEVGWLTPQQFVNSLRKFGYPESEIDLFRPFLRSRGFSDNF